MADTDPTASEDRIRAYEDGIAKWHAQNNREDIRHLAAAEIANCTLCDDDGYRHHTRICDHVDRTETAKRGIALVREALTKGKPA